MAAFVDLDKSPVSQVFVNKELQRVEYEVLPTIYFSCEKYGHTKEMCPSPTVITKRGQRMVRGWWLNANLEGAKKKCEIIGGSEKTSLGSRFMVLNKYGLDKDDLFMDIAIFEEVNAKLKGKESSKLKKGDVEGLVDSNGSIGHIKYRLVGSGGEGMKSMGQHNGGDTNLELRVVENIANDLLQYQIKSGRNNGKRNGLGVAGWKMLNSLAVQFAALDNHLYVYKTNLVLVPSDLEDSEQLGNCSNDSSSFSSFTIESPVITTHINPTFEKLEETLVVLDETLLDPMRHSVVIFKENSNHNESEGSSEGRPNGTGKGVLNSKIHIPSDRSVSSQNGKRFNRTICNRRDRFKLVGSTRAPLSNIINSIVKLIPLN
ncbi:hypothetical protein GOBAR_DD27638 [Gossypium barbadense]|nr:hypothetical protein GOBAR_DD27638 [Gossypium barbadense]